MKRFALIIVLALCALAPVAEAQQGLNLGAVLQFDKDRIEAAPGVSFGMAVYSAKPPRSGYDSTDLAGLFSSSLGQYPVVYRGLYAILKVFPGGFKNLEGVDFDPSGQLPIDAKEGWEPMAAEPGGGFSTIWKAERLGALPLRFRVRHRDGRDKFSLLIFTATWTRGGNLPTALEIMTQRPPADCPTGEAVLPYLRGFLPATATRNDAGTQSQQANVPAQTVTQTVTVPPTKSDKDEVREPDHRSEPTSPSDELTEYNSVDLFVWQSALAKTEIANRDCLTHAGDELVVRAIRQGKQSPKVTSLELDSCKWHTAAVVLEDTRRFTAELTLKDKTVAVEVNCVGGKYRAVLYGSVTTLANGILNITDAQGNLRTVTFDDRPDNGQGDKR